MGKARVETSLIIVSSLASIMILFILIPFIALYVDMKIGVAKTILTNNMLRTQFFSAMKISLEASLIAVVLLLLLGIPLAYVFAWKSFPGKSLAESLVDMPLVMPHAVAGIMILAAYGGQGLIGPLLENIGIRIEDSFAGIVAVMMFVSAPLLIDTIKVGFQSIDENIVAVARSLGASSFHLARTIFIPLVWRSIIAGALLAWARGLSEVGALLIVAYYPKTINILILEYFTIYGFYYSLTLSALYSLLIIIIFIIIRKMVRNDEE